MLYLLNNEPNIDKTYLYTKDPYEAKYQLLNNKHKSVALKHCDDPKVFIEYSNEIENIFKNPDKYNPNKKQKILIEYYF